MKSTGHILNLAFLSCGEWIFLTQPEVALAAWEPLIENGENEREKVTERKKSVASNLKIIWLNNSKLFFFLFLI